MNSNEMPIPEDQFDAFAIQRTLINVITKDRDYWRERCDGVTRFNQPYNIIDILERLSAGCKKLLNKHNYDGPDYEEMELCIKGAKEIIEQLKKQQHGTDNV